MNHRVVRLLVILSGTVIMFTAIVGLVSQHAAADVPFEDQKDSLEAGINWLVAGNQNLDGGYGIDFGTGEPLSNVSATLDSVLALAAAGYNPAASYAGNSGTPLSYLENSTDTLADFAAQNGGSAGKVVLGLVASAQEPRSFGGQDWTIKVTDSYSPTTGQYDTVPFGHSLAMMALISVNEALPPDSIVWLREQQAADGSWDDGFGTSSNPDATAMAMMALIAAGVPLEDDAVSDALNFFADSQLASAGWEYGSGFGENANSTALVIQALSAAGENFYDAAGPWSVEDLSPLDALLAWQAENGAFQANFGQGKQDDFFATVQSIPAVTGKPYPLPGRHEAARQGLNCLQFLQDAVSGGWEQFAGVGVNAAGTSRAIEAIAAAGGDAQDGRWTPDTTNAVTALENLTPEYLAGGRGGRVGIVMQGVVAASNPYDVNDFAGQNLPLLVSSYLSATGEYDHTQFGIVAHSEAMLGLLKAGDGVDDSAVTFLLGSAEDGDWGDPDSNGLALNVLGRVSASSPETIPVLRSSQTADGGWGFGGTTGPSSSSEVVQGLVSYGQNPFAPNWSQVIAGKVSNAADAIMNQQLANGCWSNLFGPGDDPFSTTDAILLLSAEPQWPSSKGRLPAIYAP